MPDQNKPAATITQASPISIGLLTIVCGAVIWMATTTATMSTKLQVLPMMQQDIRDVKQLLTVNNGIDMRQDAEIRALESRQDRQDTRLSALEKGR